MWKVSPTKRHFCLFLFCVASTLVKGVRRPRFLGSGHITLPRLTNAVESLNINLKIYPEHSKGLLLFSGRFPNGESDFFSLILDDSFAIFRFDCGSGVAEVRSRDRVQLGVNSTIIITRVKNNATIRVNDQSEKTVTAPGNFEAITFNTNLYLGGYSELCKISTRVGTRYQFEGCVQELIINNHNYNFLLKQHDGDAVSELEVGDCIQSQCDQLNCSNIGECGIDSCMCPRGYSGIDCSKSKAFIKYPKFTSNGYIALPVLENSQENFDFEIKFRPSSLNGLLLYSGSFPEEGSDFFSLSLVNGYVYYRVNCGSGLYHRNLSVPIGNNRDHTVVVYRLRKYFHMSINPNGELISGVSPGDCTEINFQTNLYVGGHPELTSISSRTGTSSYFSGCIKELRNFNIRYDLTDDSLEIVDQTLSSISTCSSDGCTYQTCYNEGRYGRCTFDTYDLEFCLYPESY